MSLPFDEGRDPSAQRSDYRSGAQFMRDEFRNKHSQFEYWRNRPLLELQLMIRRLENEDNPESTQMAQILRQIESELHDEPRAQQSLREQRGSRSAPTSPIRSHRTLPPSAISGRITGGNFPRQPTVADYHPGYSQMSQRTQDFLSERHRVAQDQSHRLPHIRSSSVDRHIEDMRNYDIGLRRQPYTKEMRTGVGLDVDRHRAELPQNLARRFRDLSLSSQRADKRDSKYTRLASQEVWKQRQLDKKYHPKPIQQRPRQHEFGPQQRQLYIDHWKRDAQTQMPFNPVLDYFGDKPTDRPLRASSIPAPQSRFKQFTTKFKGNVSKPAMPPVEGTTRERTWSRSGPDLFEEGSSTQSIMRTTAPIQLQTRAAYDPERPRLGQRVADSYLTAARSGHQMNRQQRLASRRQMRPFREDEERLGIDMSENALEWELAHRYEENPVLAAFGDYSRSQRNTNQGQVRRNQEQVRQSANPRRKRSGYPHRRK